MRRFRWAILALIPFMFEAGLLLRGVCQQRLSSAYIFNMSNEMYVSYKNEMQLIERCTGYANWLPKMVRDSQIAYGRKIWRKYEEMN